MKKIKIAFFFLWILGSCNNPSGNGQLKSELNKLPNYSEKKDSFLDSKSVNSDKDNSQPFSDSISIILLGKTKFLFQVVCSNEKSNKQILRIEKKKGNSIKRYSLAIAPGDCVFDTIIVVKGEKANCQKVVALDTNTFLLSFYSGNLERMTYLLKLEDTNCYFIPFDRGNAEEYVGNDSATFVPFDSLGKIQIKNGRIGNLLLSDYFPIYDANQNQIILVKS